jgi:hypothetical protein
VGSLMAFDFQAIGEGSIAESSLAGPAFGIPPPLAVRLSTQYAEVIATIPPSSVRLSTQYAEVIASVRPVGGVRRSSRILG